MATTIDESTNPETNDERDTRASGGTILLKIRPIAFYLSLLLAGVMTVMFLPDLLALLVVGWTAEAGVDLGIHRVHLMGIATVVTVFLLGLFAQVYQPRQRIASMWGAFVVILTVSIGTVAFGVGRPEEVLPFLFLAGIALIAHPGGRRLLRRGDFYSPALVGLLAIAAVPILVFVVGQLNLTTNTADPHASMGHYVMMTALALSPLAYGIFAALGFSGWRLAAWLAALPIAYYGLLSIAFPLQSGSTGVLWGAAAIAWAVAFVAIAEASRVGESAILRRHVNRSN